MLSPAPINIKLLIVFDTQNIFLLYKYDFLPKVGTIFSHFGYLLEILVR